VIAKLETIKLKCLEYKILWHVDGVQSVGRLAISFHNLGANALSFGAHKFGGPRGVGGLIIKQGTQFTPLMSGGFQEASRRPGTENPVLAAGMARALELWWKERQVRYSHLLALRNRFEEGLHKLSETKGLRFNITGEDVERLPNTSNVTFDGVDGEALLVALDLRGVCCSMGSACASGSPEPAPVLLAMGYAEKDARSTLRFSFGMTNTPDEIDQLLTILGEVLSTMNAMDRAK
jgi:cysteine desulfurase